MNKFSAQQKGSSRFKLAEAGVVNPLMIGGVVVVGIIVFLVASGSLKFSGYIKTDNSQTQDQTQVQSEESQPQETTKQEEPKSESLSLSENYTHSSPAFTFKYPKDWGLDTKERQVTIYTKDDGAENAKDSPAGMVVSVAPLSDELKDKKIATLGDLLKTQIEKQFPNATTNESSETKLGTNDSFVYKIVYPNKATDFQANIYLLTDGSNLYTLFLTARKDRFEKYEPTLQSIAETLTLP